MRDCRVLSLRYAGPVWACLWTMKASAKQSHCHIFSMHGVDRNKWGIVGHFLYASARHSWRIVNIRINIKPTATPISDQNLFFRILSVQYLKYFYTPPLNSMLPVVPQPQLQKGKRRYTWCLDAGTYYKISSDLHEYGVALRTIFRGVLRKKVVLVTN